jgi:bacteriocin biosynthesis cyclodehydratase domain-containing protein
VTDGSGARAGTHPARRPALRLRPTLEPFPASDGNVYLLDGGPSPELVIEDATPAQRALLDILAGGVADVAELQAALERRGFGPESVPAGAVVEQLRESGVLDPPPVGAISARAAERFGRQLPYFAAAAPGRHPEETQARLRDARVVVLGCGGLGSWTLSGLACAGVGTLVLVDDDTVELSNLNRQILFDAGDLGAPKVQAAARTLAAFDPDLILHTVPERVRSAADVAALLDGADLLVEAAEWPPYLLPRWVNEACHAAGVPHISAGQAPPILRVGPLYVPGVTACHACQEAATREAYPLAAELEAFRRARPMPMATTLGPAAGLLGSILAMEVLHRLTGLTEPATLGTSLGIDMRTLRLRADPVVRRPDCPVCGGAAAS